MNNMFAVSYGFRCHSPSLDSDDVDLDDQFQDLLREHFESGKGLNDGIDVEPLFFDGEGELERIEQVEEETPKDEREAEEKKREVEEKERREEETKRSWKKHESVLDSIREFDPMKKTIVWTRYFMDHFGAFDLDEEPPVPPMRHTGIKYEEGCSMRWSVNIFSIKIESSDVGFPINVYGTVIARDSLDHKCIYLFRCCHRRDSQLIKSEEESFVLTGPFWGFYLEDFIFLEVDLKIRHDQGTDQQLRKGVFEIDGRVVTRQEVEVKSVSHASWFSTVKLHYAAVPKAVEATVEFQALQGDFYGEITAHTTSILNRIVLYDSSTGGMVTCDDNGAIQLLRLVVAANLDEMLIFTIVARAGNSAAAAASTRVVEFAPSVNGADEDIVYCGAVKLRVKVPWSVINGFY